MQKTEAQKGNAQKVEAQASWAPSKVASGAQQKREQLAATGASNMLVIECRWIAVTACWYAFEPPSP